MSELNEEEIYELLEKLIDRCSECKFATCENCEINWKQVQAIKGLLDLYKQEKKKIQTIKKLMSINDITDEALFTLVQTTMAELERLEDVEEKLDEEKEKNKKLEKHQKQYLDGELITAKQDKMIELLIEDLQGEGCLNMTREEIDNFYERRIKLAEESE